MKRLWIIPVIGACAASAAIGATVLAAGMQEYKPKAVTKSLFDGSLDGLPNKRTIIKTFTFEPGYRNAWHYHPAHVFVYVVEGELTVDIPGEPRKTLRAGELYQEKVGQVMSGGNASTRPTKIVVFQIGDADKPMMIKANPK